MDKWRDTAKPSGSDVDVVFIEFITAILHAIMKEFMATELSP